MEMVISGLIVVILGGLTVIAISMQKSTRNLLIRKTDSIQQTAQQTASHLGKEVGGVKGLLAEEAAHLGHVSATGDKTADILLGVSVTLKGVDVKLDQAQKTIDEIRSRNL